MPPSPALPVLQPARPERVDAARNREAILCAARRLLAEQQPEAITMEQLAEAAGVGKGTVFRRFGDRAGVFHALLDDSEQRLQEGFIRGPAPLGPGAPEGERIVAFGHALIDLTAERGELLLAAIPAGFGVRFANPVHLAHWNHLVVLLEPLTGPGRAPYLADVLLAALAPELILHQLRRGASVSELRTWFGELAERLLASVDPSTRM